MSVIFSRACDNSNLRDDQKMIIREALMLATSVLRSFELGNPKEAEGILHEVHSKLFELAKSN